MSGQLAVDGGELEGALLVGHVASRLGFMQHVPDESGELASNGDDSFVRVHALAHVVKLAFEAGVVADRAASGFDKDIAEVATAGFGDGARTIFLTALIDLGAKTGVAAELVRAGEARDVTDGAEECHGMNDAKAEELHDASRLRAPGVRLAEVGHLSFNASNVG